MKNFNHLFLAAIFSLLSSTMAFSSPWRASLANINTPFHLITVTRNVITLFYLDNRRIERLAENLINNRLEPALRARGTTNVVFGERGHEAIEHYGMGAGAVNTYVPHTHYALPHIVSGEDLRFVFELIALQVEGDDEIERIIADYERHLTAHDEEILGRTMITDTRRGVFNQERPLFTYRALEPLIAARNTALVWDYLGGAHIWQLFSHLFPVPGPMALPAPAATAARSAVMAANDGSRH